MHWKNLFIYRIITFVLVAFNFRQEITKVDIGLSHFFKTALLVLIFLSLYNPNTYDVYMYMLCSY